MLHASRRSMAVVSAVTLISAASAVPTTASAKTKKIKITTSPMKLGAGGKLTATAKGTFGKSDVKGTAAPPKIVLTFKFKGGTVTATSRDAKADHDSGVITGTLKLKGSGKYKKLKGTGKLTGSFSTLVFSATGTVKY